MHDVYRSTSYHVAAFFETGVAACSHTHTHTHTLTHAHIVPTTMGLHPCPLTVSAILYRLQNNITPGRSAETPPRVLGAPKPPTAARP